MSETSTIQIPAEFRKHGHSAENYPVSASNEGKLAVWSYTSVNIKYVWGTYVSTVYSPRKSSSIAYFFQDTQVKQNQNCNP